MYYVVYSRFTMCNTHIPSVIITFVFDLLFHSFKKIYIYIRLYVVNEPNLHEGCFQEEKKNVIKKTTSGVLRHCRCRDTQ